MLTERDMKTFGRTDTQELISVVLDEAGQPRLDTLKPQHAAEDWAPPPLVPLVKLPRPEITVTQACEPVLAWFADRVERGWSVRDKTPEELAAEARKTWKDVQAFVQDVLAVAPNALAQLELSTDSSMAQLRGLLSIWRADVWSDHPLIHQGFAALQAAGILTAEQIADICSRD